MARRRARESHARGGRGGRGEAHAVAGRRDALDRAKRPMSGAGADCATFEALLAVRADVGLDATQAHLLTTHLAACAACRTVADAIPEAAAGYELGPEIARGGMGRIRLARDRRIGRDVPVKELIRATPELAARFEREALVTARLQHPGIVPIYEIGRWSDGTPYYTMRNVAGRTLREALRAARSLRERLAFLPAVVAATEAVA